jgi:hypothetical protein
VAGTQENISFNEHIRPILSDNCFACHGTDAGHRKAKLRLDQGAEALASRDGIRAFAPGDLVESEAWQRILSDDPEEVMPPPDSHKLPLKPEQRARLTVLQSQFGGRAGPQQGKTPGVVWILKDKKPWPVPVRVGASDGSFSEIEGEIKPGDQVIIGGGPKPLPTMRSPLGGGSSSRPRT